MLPDKSIGSAQIDVIQDDPHVDAMHRRRVRHAHRQSRQAVFDTVHAKEGLSYSEIARRTGYGRRSIAKWLTFETPPDRQKAALKPTSPLYFEAFLGECWKDGNRCGRHLFHDIKQRGYTGSFSNLERLLASWRRAERSVKDSASPAPVIPYHPDRDAVIPIRDPETGHVISPVVAAALCIKPRGMLTINQASKVHVLKQRSPEFALLRSLALRFRGILRSGESSKLDIWVDDTISSGLAPDGPVRAGLAPRHWRRSQRHRIALEQRPGRRPDQPPQDDQTCDVWESRHGAPQSTHATAHQ